MGWLVANKRRPRKHSMPIFAHRYVLCFPLYRGENCCRGKSARTSSRTQRESWANSAVHYKKSRKDRCFVSSPPFFQPSSLLFFNIDGSRAWKAYDTTFRTRTYTFPSSFCPPAPREEVERSLPDQKYSPRASRHPRRGFRGTERGEGTSIRR